MPMVAQGSEKMEFIEALQSPKIKIKHPTQRGFKLATWKKHELEYEFHQRQSQAAHSFGTILFQTLELLRDWLTELDRRKPASLNNGVLRRHFVSLSNRHRKAFAQQMQQRFDEFSASNQTDDVIINNLSGLPGAAIGPEDSNNGHLTITDSAHQMVDNFRLILGSLLARRKVDKCEESFEPLDEMEWLHFQEMGSALYDLLESYWHLVVYEENIPLYDTSKNLLLLNPVFNELNVAKTVSLMRMENHRAAVSAITGSFVKNRQASMDYKFPIEAEKSKGVSYRAVQLKDQDFELQGIYASAKNDIGDIKDSISESVCSKESSELGFSLSDVFDVFLSLRIFSAWKYGTLSNNTSYFKKGDLSRFNFEVDIGKLAQVVSTCVGFPKNKTKKILEFLHFDFGSDYDLWSNPFIKKNDSKSFVLIAPFMEAVLSRNAEFWLRQLNISLSNKGDGFEEYIRNRINKSIENSPLSATSFQVPEKMIRFSGQFEEIDSLVLIGNRALVIEIKNIVAVDSPVSFGTASRRIKEGVEQAKRKSEFIKNNRHEFVSRYNLDIEADELETVPLVFVSNFICAGCVIDGVSITDQLIFEAFFIKKGLIPILSHDAGTSISHKVEVEIYKSSSDAQDKIEKYLSNPPQLRLMKDALFCAYYESSIQIIPGSKAVLRRLEVSQEHELNTILNTDFGFPLIVNK
ncbi:hypothetical protein DOQ08_00985 [Marinobacter litoralis]|uniref:NERD domain-containing protein n=2 Tax=Marinobacteraceae TaxID=2887365 RepID=A0A3M2RLY6_9GAMM|nr:hypothetical protein [Marinobacter sp. S0848L]RMJ06298.1 hypothetical protein DOQ08_00985 [Marinobacter litoralis]